MWLWLAKSDFCATNIEVVLLMTYFQPPWTCLSIYTFPLSLNSAVKSLFFVAVTPPKWWGNVSVPGLEDPLLLQVQEPVPCAIVPVLPTSAAIRRHRLLSHLQVNNSAGLFGSSYERC